MASNIDTGRPRSSSFELYRSSKPSPDYGSFTITHVDVPSPNNHHGRRSKSMGNIKDSLHYMDDKNGFSKLLRSRLHRSSDTVSTKSWSSSECVDEVIYEEDEEYSVQNDPPKHKI